MRFYTKQHTHYCGIDLHARTMYLLILNQAGAIVLHRNMKSDPDSFLKAIARFARISWLPSNASSRGTGWPICALEKRLLSFSATHCT